MKKISTDNSSTDVKAVMQPRSKRLANAGAFLLGVGVMSFITTVSTQATDFNYASTPLFWNSGAQPNVMLFIDNSGSMRNITYSASYAEYTNMPTFITTNNQTGNSADDATDPFDTRWNFCTSAAAPTPSSFTVKSTGAFNTGTETIKINNHGWSTGDVVTYDRGSSTLIGGLTNGGTYFVIKTGTNTIKLATSAANATAGTAVNITSSGSNNQNHTFTQVIDTPMRCTGTRAVGTDGTEFTVQTPVNGSGTYIAGTPAVIKCDISAGYTAADGFTLATSSTSAQNTGVLVSDLSGSGQSTARQACVRFKEATTAVSPRKASGSNCVTNSAGGSAEAVSLNPKCPSAIDVQTNIVGAYASYLLTNVAINYRAPGGSIGLPPPTAIAPGSGASIDFSDSVNRTSTTTSVPDVITPNPDYPPDVTATITDKRDYRIIPNLNRIEAARQASNAVYDKNKQDLRMGLAVFISGKGADIQNKGAEIKSYTDPGAGNLTEMQQAIKQTRATTNTPLTKALYEITRYFLGLTPENTASGQNTGGTFKSPIQYRCQKSYVVMMTDGEPTSDVAASGCGTADIPSKYADLNVAPNNVSTLPAPTVATMPNTFNYDGVADACFGGDSSAVLDDMSQWAYDKDLRSANAFTASGICPDGTNPPVGQDCTKKSFDALPYKQQNLVTYTVGFGLRNDMLVETPETARITAAGPNLGKDARRTFLSSAINAAADTITINAHGYSTGDKVTYHRELTESGTTAPGLTELKQYYVYKVDNNTIKLAENADGTNIVNITGIGSGNHVLGQGPGKFYAAMTASDLSDALGNAFTEINAISASASAVAANSTSLNGGTRVYQAAFNTEDWSGSLKAYSFITSGPQIGTINYAAPDWSAASSVTAANRGTMYTWRPTSTGTGTTGTSGASGTVKVIGNDASNLSTAQKASLSNGGAVSADDVVKWLKGQTITGFRDRTHGIIGDIVNASPTYVSNNLNFNYMKITDPCVANTGGASYASGTGCTGGKLYQSYVDGNATRQGVVYFGANDGQLHAVDGATGAEIMSFIPNGVFSSYTDTNEDGLQGAGETVDNKLFALSQPYYAHRYFLDATPVVGDVWNGSAWKTWLVSGLGAGGRSIFAMDVTSPAGIEVQWEFNHANLGYTFGKPIIARLQSGEWVVLVANGYDSGGDKAQLLILDVFTGTLIAKIDTGVGSAALPNGLTGTEVVLDSNRTVKGVYGGDLRGNLWYFDMINKTTTGTWASPPAARKVFTATDSLGQPQPITGGIEVGAIPGVTGTLVLFGTGKYFEVLDASYTGAPKEDTFYAVLDNGSLVNKSDLDKRIYAPVGTGYRTTNSVPSGATTVDYTSKKGWKLDLMEASKYEGEKVISQPLLRQGRIIFVSIVPENADRCVGGGSSWLTEVDAMTGLPLSKPVFDTNNDGRIDGSDNANISGYGDSTGILSDPTIVEGNLKDSNDTNTETKIQSSTGGLSITTTLEDKSSPIPAAGIGRMSWQQLQ